MPNSARCRSVSNVLVKRVLPTKKTKLPMSHGQAEGGHADEGFGVDRSAVLNTVPSSGR